MLSPNKIRIPFLIFTLYFLVISAGLPLHKHYCQGDLKFFSFLFQSDGCHDNCCDDESSGDCCSDMCSVDFDEKQACSLEGGECCSDEVELVKVDYVSIKVSSEALNSEQIPDHYAFDSWLATDFSVKLSKSYSSYKYHKEKAPPSKLKLVLYQQFLC